MTTIDEVISRNTLADLAKEFLAKALHHDLLSDAEINRILLGTVDYGRQPDGDYVVGKATGTVQTIDYPTGLSAGQTITSNWFDSDGWESIEVVIKSDQVSASDGLIFQFTDDVEVATPSVFHPTTRTYNADNASHGSQVFRLGPTGDGFRVSYTNGGTPTGPFKLQVNAHEEAVELPQSGYHSTITGNNLAVMTRGMMIAETDAGVIDNIKRSLLGGLRISIKEQEAEIQQKSCSTHRADVVSVTSGTAQQADTTKLTNRKYVTISNNDGTKTLWYGTLSTLTAGNQSIPLPAGASHQQEWDSSLDVYWVSATGSIQASISQSGGTV